MFTKLAHLHCGDHSEVRKKAIRHIKVLPTFQILISKMFVYNIQVIPYNFIGFNCWNPYIQLMVFNFLQSALLSLLPYNASGSSIDRCKHKS